MTGEIGINVLSLFDGMSCGQIALERAGVKVANYYASEIDKSAIAATKANYPNTIHCGDIVNLKSSDLPKIDLIIGGSPCQGFSIAGKQLNFEDPRSKLFFEFHRLLNECKPKWFLLENVPMKKEFEDAISWYLGCYPRLINSSLVSAQNRKRLYWTNIKFEEIKDKGVKLIDILEHSEQPIITALLKEFRINKATIIGRRLNAHGRREDYNKSIPAIQCLEVRASNTEKSNCLTTVDKDNVLTPLAIGRYPDVFKKKLPFRYYTLREACRLQTVPDDYFDGVVSASKAKKMLGNGWTVDVITHIFKNLT